MVPVSKLSDNFYNFLVEFCFCHSVFLISNWSGWKTFSMHTTRSHLSSDAFIQKVFIMDYCLFTNRADLESKWLQNKKKPPFQSYFRFLFDLVTLSRAFTIISLAHKFVYHRKGVKRRIFSLRFLHLYLYRVHIVLFIDDKTNENKRF